MMITDQIATALAAILTASGLPHSPTIQTAVSTTENEAEVLRVIATALTSELRKPNLPGIYDVSGEVAILQGIGDTNAETNFRAVCEAIRHVVGSKYQMPVSLKSQDADLHVYSWNLTGQENFNNGIVLGARFLWTACARQDPHNPN